MREPDWQTDSGRCQLYLGECRAVLREMPERSVQCCVTSPPYWGLRDYGHAEQLGLEPTPELYVEHMVEVFREVRRVLRDDGVLWLNLGDSYTSTAEVGRVDGGGAGRLLGSVQRPRHDRRRIVKHGLKPKDLVGIPWRVAFALQADGWYLRQDIIWCLSGGTWLYVRTQKGDMPMTVKDVSRLDPSTVKLWNGEKWTQLLGMNKSKRRGEELEIVLRSGERISCTPTHKWPTNRGLLEASELVVGDMLKSCLLPEPDNPRDCAIDVDAAWFAGLYIAEGSRSQDTIQISGHRKESARWERVQAIARKFGGSATRTIDGNGMSIRVYGKFLNAIIDELVAGRTARDKGFSPVVWRYSDGFIAAMLDGYLCGDGHADGDRWRIGFCRNYSLERDIRTACARIGYTLTLNLSTVKYKGKSVPTFRGEIRKFRTGHRNERSRNEIVEIRKSRCRDVYDLGVDDEPHVFALASGILTHNSKPNPMPESVTDRCTKAHEYVFLMSKSARYFYDAEAVKESAVYAGIPQSFDTPYKNAGRGSGRAPSGNEKPGSAPIVYNTRNRRSVWTVATQPYSGAHFATYPPALIEPCILAGTSERGACRECGSPWERVVEGEKYSPAVVGVGERCVDASRGDKVRKLNGKSEEWKRAAVRTTTGWQPTCNCNAGEPVPCVVLDPFNGSGTTGQVCIQHGRAYRGIELNPEYLELAKRRLLQAVRQHGTPLFD